MADGGVMGSKEWFVNRVVNREHSAVDETGNTSGLININANAIQLLQAHADSCMITDALCSF